MGTADIIIRFIIAAFFGIFYFTGIVAGTFGVVLLVMAGVFVFTSAISFCPLYTLLGINTCGLKEKK